MTTEAISVAVYGQHCSGLAGRLCCDPEARYGEDWRESDDLQVFEGTRDELAATAASYRRAIATAGAGDDLFLLRLAQRIEEAIKNS